MCLPFVLLKVKNLYYWCIKTDDNHFYQTNLTDLCVSTQKGGHKTDGFSNIVTLHSPIFLVIVD